MEVDARSERASCRSSGRERGSRGRKRSWEHPLPRKTPSRPNGRGKSVITNGMVITEENDELSKYMDISEEEYAVSDGRWSTEETLVHAKRNPADSAVLHARNGMEGSSEKSTLQEALLDDARVKFEFLQNEKILLLKEKDKLIESEEKLLLQNSGLVSKLQCLNAEISRLKEENQEIEKEKQNLATANSEVEILREELVELRKTMGLEKKRRLKPSKSMATTDDNEEQKMEEEWRLEIENLTTMLEEKKRELIKAQSEVEKVTERWKLVERDTEILEDAMVDLESEKKALKVEVKSLKSDLKVANEKLKSEVDRMRSEWDKSEDLLRAQFMAKIEEETVKRKRDTRTLEKLAKDLEVELMEIKKRMQKRKDDEPRIGDEKRISFLEGELRKSNCELADSRKEISRLKEKMDKMWRFIDKLKSDLERQRRNNEGKTSDGSKDSNIGRDRIQIIPADQRDVELVNTAREFVATDSLAEPFLSPRETVPLSVVDFQRTEKHNNSSTSEVNAVSTCPVLEGPRMVGVVLDPRPMRDSERTGGTGLNQLRDRDEDNLSSARTRGLSGQEIIKLMANRMKHR